MSPAVSAPSPSASPAAGRRPEILPLFVACFVVGSQAGMTWRGPWHLLFAVLTATGLGLSLGIRLRGWGGWVPLVLAALGAGGLNGALRAERPVPAEVFAAFDGTTGELDGVFVGEFRLLKRGGLSFVMEQARLAVASQTIDLPGRLRCQVPSTDLLPEPGQRYLASGTFHSSDGRNLPQFAATSLQPVGTALAPGRILGRLQRAVRDRVGALLPSRHQALMVAFLLGDTSGLDYRDRGLFRTTGVSHLMAVSGQHVLVLVCFLAAVLSWTGVPPLSRALLVLGILLVYGGLTVGNPSVWRAIAMYLASVAAVHLEADPGPVRPVALTALVLLLVEPAWLGHIGFQLSFAAVLGIIYGRRPLEVPLCRLGLPLPVARYLAVSLAANLATMPLVAFHYGTVSLASFVANPLLVWTFAVILPVGLLLPALGAFWEPVGVMAASGLALFLDLFLRVLEACAALPLAQVWVGEIPGFGVALAYAALLALVTPLTFWGREPAPTPEGVAAEPALHAMFLAGAGAARPGSRPPGPLIAPLRQRFQAAGAAASSASGVGPEPGPAAGEPPSAETPPPLEINPLHLPDLVEAIDQQLAVFPKRPLKGQGRIEAITFPVRQLSVEGQTLFHRLDDLGPEVLRQHPDRLLQAQVYLLALLGSELLVRIIPRLEPVPTPADLPVPGKARNRHLALALLTDAFFHSPLPARAGGKARVVEVVAAAHALHREGCRRLHRYISRRNAGDVADFLAARGRVLEWLKTTGDLAPEVDPRRRPAPGSKA
ncbi:MAG: hypothetical protein GX442_07180 [Candidatus Riflebacteria bacterium]|nr:hypothetical protein [Candidatus Riflebacteria bacterium]